MSNNYKLVNWISRINWEGAIIENIESGKKYITNGVCLWEVSPERINKCSIVSCIDKEKFYSTLKKFFTYIEIEE